MNNDKNKSDEQEIRERNQGRNAQRRNRRKGDTVNHIIFAGCLIAVFIGLLIKFPELLRMFGGGL